MELLAGRMTQSHGLHRFEVRACELTPAAIEGYAYALLRVARQVGRPIRVQVGGYRDVYTLVERGRHGFRSEVQRGWNGSVVSSAPGLRAPPLQLARCVDGERLLEGVCPRR